MKNVLILGATSDIARALAHAYAAHGDAVVLAARNPADLEDDVKDLSIRHNTPITSVAFDALDFGSHQDFWERLKPRPDLVVCVFGALGDLNRAENNFEEAHMVIDTNFTGAVSILNIVAGDFQRSRSGAIVGISSVAGDRGRQSNYIYGAAKAGFSTYLSGLRNRLHPAGINVLTVKPGFVATKMTEGMDLPPKLTAQPSQIASIILNAQIKGRNVIYTPWFWWLIMNIIRHIPETVFKRLKL